MYDPENGIREYYCNARTNGLSIAPQEWGDRGSKASAFLVVPVTGTLAEFLSASLVMTLPSETFMFHTCGSYKSTSRHSKTMKVALLILNVITLDSFM